MRVEDIIVTTFVLIMVSMILIVIGNKKSNGE